MAETPMGGETRSAELGFGILTPTPAIRPVPDHDSPQDSWGKKRHRSQKGEEQTETDPPSGGSILTSGHHLDRLA